MGLEGPSTDVHGFCFTLIVSLLTAVERAAAVLLPGMLAAGQVLGGLYREPDIVTSVLWVVSLWLLVLRVLDRVTSVVVLVLWEVALLLLVLGVLDRVPVRVVPVLLGVVLLLLVSLKRKLVAVVSIEDGTVDTAWKKLLIVRDAPSGAELGLQGFWVFTGS